MSKRKFRFNAVDAVIILIVLAAFAVFAFVFLSDKAPEEEDPVEDVKIQYVLQTTETRERYVNNIAAADVLYTDDGTKEVGTVVSVTDSPSYYVAGDSVNAVQVVSDIEGRRNMFITVEANAKREKTGYTVNGSPIAVGGSLKVKTPNLYTSTSIISIEEIG